MVQTPHEDDLRRYLLGGASESDRRALEDRYAEDEALFEQLVCSEEDLVDDFLRGLLSANERALFEARAFCSPRWRERIAAASAWRLVAEKREAARVALATATQSRRGPFARRGSLWSAAAAAAAIVAIVSGALWTRRPVPLSPSPSTVSRIAAPSPMATPSEKDAALAPAPRRSPRASREQILLLRAGQDRDVATARRVVLGRESGSLALQLILGEQRFPAYEAALLESDGVPVLRWTSLKPIESKTRRLLTLKVAVRVLVEDEYLVRVRGVTKDGRRELDGTYYFQVDR